MEFKQNQGIYLQIADKILNQLLEKIWVAEDRIPSVREIAIAYEVNPNTALRTFNYLEDQGIIYNKRGIGYFISPQGPAKALAIKRQQFTQHELPLFISNMKLLGITFEELKSLYDHFIP